jgi:hypothetical protein
MVLGLWKGYKVKLPLRREGVGRYCLFLLRSLLQSNSTLEVEIWTYTFNEPEVKILFQSLLNIYPDRVSIHNENTNKKKEN